MTKPPTIIHGENVKVIEPRFRLIPFDEIKLDTECRDLVRGLIPRNGVVVIWGPPKSGKSFWTFYLTMSVALGWKFRDRRVQQGSVVYCAFEGAYGFKARCEAFRQRFLAEEHDPIPFYLQGVTMNLVKDHGDLVATIRLAAVTPVAVVLDTLNRSLQGSESSDEDMGAYIQAADAIRDAFACAVLIVHHCGVDGTRPRGHTSLTGAADVQIAVKRDAAGNIVATVEYAKDGPQGDSVTSRLETIEVGTNEHGEVVTSCIVLEADEAPAVARVPAAARTALSLLHKAIADTGETAPASNHVPHGTRTIGVDLWRRYCDQGTVSESTNPDSKYKAFVRAVKLLQDHKMIGVWNDRVWIVGHAGH